MPSQEEERLTSFPGNSSLSFGHCNLVSVPAHLAILQQEDWVSDYDQSAHFDKQRAWLAVTPVVAVRRNLLHSTAEAAVSGKVSISRNLCCPRGALSAAKQCLCRQSSRLPDMQNLLCSWKSDVGQA